MILYFAYGSNLDAAQMRRRCPGAKQIGKAVLPGFRLAFGGYSPIWGGGVATVIMDKKAFVEGLFYLVPKAEIEILDRYEGFYRRMRCRIEKKEGLQQWAHIYVLPIEEESQPSPRYLEILRKAYQKLGFNWTGPDRGYRRCEMNLKWLKKRS